MTMQPPVLEKQNPFDLAEERGGGCSFGCFGIGCLAVVLGLVALAGGGWFTLMHTALPLVLIERQLESDGDVQIEGLSGSMADGLSVQSLRIKASGDRWNELRGVTFDYNSIYDIASHERFLVDQLAIEHARFYEEIAPPESLDYDPLDLLDSMFVADEELRDLRELSEVEIRLLRLGELTIANPETGYELTIDEIELRGLRMERGRLRSLGRLTIRSDWIDLDTEPSLRWPGQPAACRFVGRMKAARLPALRTDIEFVWDLLPAEAETQSALSASLVEAPRQPQQDPAGPEFHSALSALDGAVVREQSATEDRIAFADYHPADVFVLAFPIAPEQISFTARHPRTAAAEHDPAAPPGAWQVQEPGEFTLGKTRFFIPPSALPPCPPRTIVGQASVEGKVVLAEVRADRLFQDAAPRLRVDDAPADPETWSRVVFDRSLAELTADQRAALDGAIAASEAPPAQEAETDEPPDDSQPAERPPAANPPPEADDRDDDQNPATGSRPDRDANSTNTASASYRLIRRGGEE